MSNRSRIHFALYGKRSIAAAVSLLMGCAGESVTGPSVTSAVKHETSPCPCTYVANYGGNSITVYPVSANGNVAPIRRLYGSNTGLHYPFGVAVDASGNLYVANGEGGSQNLGDILIFAPNARGNVAPIAVISGPNTQVSGPAGIALDPVNGDIYIVNENGGLASPPPYITSYSAGSNGNVTPLATIEGSNTQLSRPQGVALDLSENIYVANELSSTITIFAAGSVGNVSPAGVISGSNTKLANPYPVALDSASNLYVGSGNQILTYAAGANGNVRPIRTVHGNNTKLPQSVRGLALDAKNNMYATGLERVTSYPAGSNGNVAATTIIQGGKTQLNEPWGIAVH
ncbi:MAG: hypothetical protein JOZ62_20815 [Acidobacteriaceae bacterium]|nr:hypothetical protein [Acidobacteriaceae bacterium]